MKFIDLFAGLGGFHLALSRLGHKCVFACEKEIHLQDLYEKNFGLRPASDIRAVDVSDIPKHDILCAGFPCQPFSKAGDQQGLACPKNGDLFEHVLRIVQHRKPKYLLIENVPNLKWHNGGTTLEEMEASLKKLGYFVQHERLSPHHFGIPQIRERIFIVGSRKSLSKFAWPVPIEKDCSIRSVLQNSPADARQLSTQVLNCLAVWQEFMDAMPRDVDFPACPVWTMEFGATYPYENETPHRIGVTELAKYRGAHGKQLRRVSDDDRLEFLPSHARTKQRRFPDWKVRFIRQNREFYQSNRDWIDPWLPKIRAFPPSLQKLEWNCRGEERDLWKYVIQFRASGVRIKRPTTAPSLIAMTTTQVPIIAWERRYMTPRECAELQSMGRLKHLPESFDKSIAALGNAVNVDVVDAVAKALINDVYTRAKRKSHPKRRGTKNVGRTISRRNATA